MRCKENMKMINVYVDADIVTSDYSETKNLWDALTKLETISSIIKINIIGEHIPDDIKPYPHDYNNFEELFESLDKITKNEVFISYCEDKLYIWDFNRGKSILAINNSHSIMEFNKIYIKESDDEILKYLRKYIHI